MSWTWRLEAKSDKQFDSIEVPAFDNQSDAETWIGDEWQTLLDHGVDAVTLLEGDRIEYSDMSLHPPQN
ncbi:hypothetical protein CLV47_11070 [Antricoccus suffuscus]|uniref:Uncharacterized protein n=1 Tax=Antricoccus suffuscus TaxID=1629062 RepID=A0A2T0ZYD2_9ACTN|nr:hypothetical protein [Antricoccus suffuscus]PRZ41343.1 hypothetical protein CLV47_11070 [Antricoccus suffuscus]